MALAKSKNTNFLYTVFSCFPFALFCSASLRYFFFFRFAHFARHRLAIEKEIRTLKPMCCCNQKAIQWKSKAIEIGWARVPLLKRETGCGKIKHAACYAINEMSLISRPATLGTTQALCHNVLHLTMQFCGHTTLPFTLSDIHCVSFCWPVRIN